MRACPHCEGQEFYASQRCRGSLTVIVAVKEQGGTVFQRNPTEDGSPDTSELEFDNPEGPFTCITCGHELEPEDRYAAR